MPEPASTAPEPADEETGVRWQWLNSVFLFLAAFLVLAILEFGFGMNLDLAFAIGSSFMCLVMFVITTRQWLANRAARKAAEEAKPEPPRLHPDRRAHWPGDPV